MRQMSWEEGWLLRPVRIIDIWETAVPSAIYMSFLLKEKGIHNSKWQEHKGSKAQGLGLSISDATFQSRTIHFTPRSQLKILLL